MQTSHSFIHSFMYMQCTCTTHSHCKHVFTANVLVVTSIFNLNGLFRYDYLNSSEWFSVLGMHMKISMKIAFKRVDAPELCNDNNENQIIPSSSLDFAWDSKFVFSVYCLVEHDNFQYVGKCIVYTPFLEFIQLTFNLNSALCEAQIEKNRSFHSNSLLFKIKVQKLSQIGILLTISTGKLKTTIQCTMVLHTSNVNFS